MDRLDHARLNKVAEDGYDRGLKFDPFNSHKRGSPEWHRWEAAYYLGRKHRREGKA